MEDWKQKKGITLIALVVTIIVLLILAGITISLVVGENGIIAKASEARIKQDNATVLERLRLTVTDYKITIDVENIPIPDIEIWRILREEGYIKSDNIVDMNKTVGKQLSTGNGTGNKDVYKVEDGILYYYDEKENKREIGTIYEGVSKVTEADYFDFDPQDGSITLKDPVSYYQTEKLSPIEEIVIPSEIDGVKVTKIGRDYKIVNTHHFGFNASNIKSIIIPDTVTEIGAGAFSGCTNLPYIMIPNSVTTIGTDAFLGCTSLQEIRLPNEVTFSEGSRWIFYGCKSLKKVNLPNNMQTISQGFFEGCTAIEKIEIPNSVTTIESRAFLGCTSLTNITIPDKVNSIGEEAFEGCVLLKSVNILSAVKELYASAFVDCDALEKIEVAENGNYKNINGVLYTKDGTTLVKCPAQLIPNKIEETTMAIGDYAFSNCTKISNISIPNTVSEIGKEAFKKCTSLQEIVIPDKVTRLNRSTFEECSALTKITIPNSVITIDDYIFAWCTSLKSIVLPNQLKRMGNLFQGCYELAEVTIPNTVTNIGGDCFRYCSSLVEITIPSSVTSIGKYAFSGCSSLTNITIEAGSSLDIPTDKWKAPSTCTITKL